MYRRCGRITQWRSDSEVGFVCLKKLLRTNGLLERNTGQQNTARHISATKYVTIVIACFFMRPEKITTVSADKTSHR